MRPASSRPKAEALHVRHPIMEGRSAKEIMGRRGEEDAGGTYALLERGRSTRGASALLPVLDKHDATGET